MLAIIDTEFWYRLSETAAVAGAAGLFIIKTSRHYSQRFLTRTDFNVWRIKTSQMNRQIHLPSLKDVRDDLDGGISRDEP